MLHFSGQHRPTPPTPAAAAPRVGNDGSSLRASPSPADGRAEDGPAASDAAEPRQADEPAATGLPPDVAAELQGAFAHADLPTLQGVAPALIMMAKQIGVQAQVIADLTKKLEEVPKAVAEQMPATLREHDERVRVEEMLRKETVELERRLELCHTNEDLGKLEGLDFDGLYVRCLDCSYYSTHEDVPRHLKARG